MINQNKFFKILNNCGVEFFTGVPDSYLNGFCNYLLENIPLENNIIAANEGNAIGIASGYYLSTGKVPMVYMQNSGVGNALNPIVSLADKDVYKIPMVLLIGWRGQPETGDHHQHKMQGEITTKLLDLMEIPYVIAKDDDDLLGKQTKEIISIAQKERKVVAIIAPNGIFTKEKDFSISEEGKYPLFRQDGIEIVLDALPKDTIAVATTGRASRELYFLREKKGQGHDLDFLNVGSMGHASSVALALAMKNKDKKVVCFDGDGGALMHLGALSMVSNLSLPNFFHVILNNAAHESVGNQPSVGMKVDFTAIGKACGYNTVNKPVANKDEIVKAINTLMEGGKASLLDIRIREGMKEKLPVLDIKCHETLANNLIEKLKK